MVNVGQHLLGIESLTKEQIVHYLDTAESFIEINERSIKKVPTLRGKTIINLFLEPSTRTRTSFEIAGKRLSADTINISASASSITKGETLIDTVLTIQAMNPDLIVMRHAFSGAPWLLARELPEVKIINAGDGLHEHPSQALLDALTMRRRLGTLENLTVTFVGDALRGRVARSNIFLLRNFGCKLRIVAPPAIAVDEFKAMGVEIYYNLAEALKGSDVVMSLRMKNEYLKDFFVPDLGEYSEHYCITSKLIKENCPDALILAPGPYIRGVEISSDVIDGVKSAYAEQVTMGVAVRMAIMYLLCAGTLEESN